MENPRKHWRKDTDNVLKASVGEERRQKENTGKTADNTMHKTEKEPPVKVQAPMSKLPPVSIDGPYHPAKFHQGLASIMQELAADRDVDAAVEKVRAWGVPTEHQANEFVNILTRALE